MDLRLRIQESRKVVAVLRLRTKLLNVQLRICSSGLRKLKFSCGFADFGLKKKLAVPSTGYSHRVGFLLTGSAKDQITQKSRRLRNAISTDGNTPTPQMTDLSLEHWPRRSPPNTAAVPNPGTIWNYRCMGIFTSSWTQSPVAHMALDSTRP